MNILNKYLKKLGLKEFSELNEQEKETYRQWEETLQGRKITDDDVKAFFEMEIEETIQKLVSKTLSERDDIFLKMKLDFIRKIIVFLQGPEIQKKALEQTIINNLN